MARVLRVLFIALVAILLLLIVVMVILVVYRLPSKVEENPEIQSWTESYSEELSAAIVRFETVTTSWEAFQEQDQASFSSVATGTALWDRQLGVEFAPNIGNYYSQTSIQLDQVKVVSYTASSAYVEAIVLGEGTIHYLETGETRDAGLLTWTLYLLVWEDETWKVTNFVSCPVPERDPDCQLPSQLDY
ncbi:MAG: hypothetical protein SXV54_06065 [Chloroflexota bacterium]|nr:hypothetical protein [Chloroflexota bacterium]